MSDRRLMSSGSPCASAPGFSRTVHFDHRIFGTGRKPIDPDGPNMPGSITAQARRGLALIEGALIEARALLSETVPKRISVTDFTIWEKADTSHTKVFGNR